MNTLTLLKSCERYALPQLHARVAPARVRHVRAVNNAFSALVKGDFPRIYDALQPNVREATDLGRYCWTLAGIRREYLSLTAKQKQELAVAVAFHDIGYLEDDGIMHGEAGARQLSGHFMRAGIRGIDRMSVSELIRFHGIMLDATAQFLPTDLERFSEAQKTQLLVLGLADAIGKPSGNNVSLRVLDTLVKMRLGCYETTSRYFNLRLRSLLGPTNYSYIESQITYDSLTDAIKYGLSPEDRHSLVRNVGERFRNHCWPVFQELVLNNNGVKAYLDLLVRLSRIADSEYKDKETIDLVFQPDFFKMPSERRQPYIDALKRDPIGDFVVTTENGQRGTMLINLGMALPR
ncbi:MAG: hypothetical protein JW782_01215 [Candidatus Saganbacteria bacterium]|nr:hypothetical protein [Candidatus Saganbacteria bacterium]